MSGSALSSTTVSPLATSTGARQNNLISPAYSNCRFTNSAQHLKYSNATSSVSANMAVRHGSWTNSQRTGSLLKTSASVSATQTVPDCLGDTLEEFMVKASADEKLRTLIRCLAEATRTIAFKIRTASCSETNCVNLYGDEQLAVDMVADGVIFDTLKFSHVCETACSEENPVPKAMGGSGYSVSFDPLDGSSIVDTDFTVGSIFGIWPGENLTGVTGRDQSAAAMSIYGPRTVICIAVTGYPGTFEFLLQDAGGWICVKETTEIGEGKLFSPGNLRATSVSDEYNKLVNYWISEGYKLRYTGGMVPDVFQILVKEQGVFSNVNTPGEPAKLRLAFEVAPLALLIENAGGCSSCDGKGVSALDVEIDGIDQRTQVCYGSIGEVRRFEEYMLGKPSSRLEKSAPALSSA